MIQRIKKGDRILASTLNQVSDALGAKIPRIYKGQALTAELMNRLIDAANSRALGAPPPSQIMKRVPPSAIIFVDDWRVVTQASPDAVPAQNVAAGVRAYSNNNGSYDSTTNGLKCVMHFEKKLTYSTVYPQIVLGYTDITNGTTYRSGKTNANSTGTLELYMRVRPITADFDPTTITWNGLSGLTVGATPMSSGYSICKLDAVTTFGSEQKCYIGSSVEVGITVSAASPGDIFGMLIDVAPMGSSTGYTVNVAQLAFRCNGTYLSAPFAVIPQ